MLLSQLLTARAARSGYHGLAQTAGRELGRTLDKTEQKGDWSGELTAEQLRLRGGRRRGPAAASHVADRQDQGGRPGSASPRSRRRALPAVAWMGRARRRIRPGRLGRAGRGGAAEAEELAGELADAAPPMVRHALLGGAGWNWNSPEQVKEAFAALGVALDSTDDDALAAVDHPLAALLREYRSTPSWLRPTGRTGTAKPCTTAASTPGGDRSAPTPAAWRARRRTSRTSRATPATAAASPPRPAACWSRRTTPRSSCASPPSSRATGRCWTPTAKGRTCTPRRPGACWASRRRPRTNGRSPSL